MPKTCPGQSAQVPHHFETRRRFSQEEDRDRMSAAESGPPGTGFLDAETGPPKSPPKTRDARRDQKGPEPIAEMPAQKAYSDLTRNYAVREDWMVGATGIEPATPS
jgi:hypothetical protein